MRAVLAGFVVAMVGWGCFWAGTDFGEWRSVRAICQSRSLEIKPLDGEYQCFDTKMKQFTVALPKALP